MRIVERVLVFPFSFLVGKEVVLFTVFLSLVFLFALFFLRKRLGRGESERERERKREREGKERQSV